MEANLRRLGASLGKTEARIGAGQKQMEAIIQTGLEEEKVMDLEVIPEIEATVETIEALEDRVGNCQRAVVYRNLQKK
jgi:hypothetical protein